MKVCAKAEKDIRKLMFELSEASCRNMKGLACMCGVCSSRSIRWYSVLDYLIPDALLPDSLVSHMRKLESKCETNESGSKASGI